MCRTDISAIVKTLTQYQSQIIIHYKETFWDPLHYRVSNWPKKNHGALWVVQVEKEGKLCE